MGGKQSPAAPQNRETVSGNARVLVVDDDQDMVDMVAIFLRLQGFEVTTARNGVEELAAASEGFDAVTTDLEMPWLRGAAK